jgi:cell division protein FtsQ
MKPIWKYILIAFFSTAVLGYLVFSLWYFSGRDKENVCRRLEIVLVDSTKVQLITEKNIAQILEENELNPIGKTIKYIHTEDIERVLRKNQMIKVAECYKTPSGIVNIRIQQRIPKFRVVGLGSYYIDVDRKPMPVSPNYAAYIPVVSGRVTVSMVTGQIFDFITFLEENPFWNAQIEQIYVRDDKKIELIPRVGEAVILLGTLDNFESKLNKLHKLYIKGFNVIGWNRYKVIDLQYKGQVVCNKEIPTVPQPVVVSEEKKDSIIASKL